MASKLIAQLVVMGTQIVGRAFMDAYRHAAANAGKTAGARAAAASNSSGAAGTSQALNELTRKTGISLEEAMNILNVERTTAIEELEKKYQHLMKVNDQKTGGSFYLQSKVHRAKERIDMERKLTEPPQSPPAPPEAPNQ